MSGKVSLLVVGMVIALGSLLWVSYTSATAGMGDPEITQTVHKDDRDKYEVGSDIIESGDSEEPIEEVEKKKDDFSEVKVSVPAGESGDEPKSSEGTETILLMGLDTRGEGFKGRTDAMVLARVNEEKVTLVSIPRDSYVNIGGNRGYDKITHAYVYGGSELAEETVEHLMGVEVDHTAVINFRSFEEVVDIVGGVEVNVPFDFEEKSRSGRWIEFSKGSQVLDGEEALAYARMRKQDPTGDIGRGQRQQDVIKGLMKEVKDVRNVMKAKEFYGVMKNHVKTDIGVMDAVGFLGYRGALDNVEMVQLEGHGKSIDGIYYHELEDSSVEEIREKLDNM